MKPRQFSRLSRNNNPAWFCFFLKKEILAFHPKVCLASGGGPGWDKVLFLLKWLFNRGRKLWLGYETASKAGAHIHIICFIFLSESIKIDL